MRAYEYLPSGPLARVRLTTPDGALTDAPILDGAAYGARGERRSLTLGNGVQVVYGYDSQTNRLATQTARSGSKRLQAISYTYDPAGNLVRIVDDAGREVLPQPGGCLQRVVPGRQGRRVLDQQIGPGAVRVDREVVDDRLHRERQGVPQFPDRPHLLGVGASHLSKRVVVQRQRPALRPRPRDAVPR